MRCVFAIVCLGSLLACGDDSVVDAESLDAGSPEAAAPERCAGLAPLAIAAAPTRVRAGGRVTLEATGGSGQYVFSLAAPGTGSGGAIEGSAFIAGATPASDTIVVKDAACPGETSAIVTVVPPFRVSPRTAVVRPGATFTISVEGVLGNAVFELLSSAAASTLAPSGVYTAGTGEGVDSVRVRDDVGGDEAILTYEVRTDAKLDTPYPRIAAAPGASFPLRASGGSDTVVWEKTSGGGAVHNERFTTATSDPAPVHLRGRDAFTNDVIEIDVTVLTPMAPPGPVGDALGSSVALSSRGATGVSVFGAPSFQDHLGRVVAFDIASAATSVPLEGAATPLARGRRVGAGVAFTDFNGDGRPDLVAGAPELVIPTSDVRATEVTPMYAVDRAACIPQAAQSKGGVLISLAQADGTFVPAYRLWRDASGVGDLGLDVAGGFDFNGDGRSDLVARRTNGAEIFLGRAPDDATLAKLTMGCDAALSIPALPAPVVALAPLGDLDGDGCDDVAVGYHDATHGGVLVAFGFDPGGTRCGSHTTSRTIRISADADAGESYLGLGTAVARDGAFLGGSTRWLAIGATKLSVSGMARPGVLLVDAAQLAALRPATGSVVRGLTEAGVTTHVLTSVEPLAGVGASIIGNADVTGDGVVDLVVGAPNASFAAAGAGVALVFAGGAASTGMQRPWMLVTGDDGPGPAGLGGATALLPAAAGRPAFVAVGSPSSARSGAGNGAGYLLAFP